MRKWIEIYLIAFAGIAITCGMSVSSLAQAPRYDLLLKGGHVIDPANNLDGIMDVAVSKDKIAAVEKDIPASHAGKVVDASGLYVTPGLINPEASVQWSRTHIHTIEQQYMGVGGHFFQEDHAVEIGAAIRDWLGRVVSAH